MGRQGKVTATILRKANFRKIVRCVRKFDVKCRDTLENGRFEVSDDSCTARKKRGEDGRSRGRRHLFTKITQPPKLVYHSIGRQYVSKVILGKENICQIGSVVRKMIPSSSCYNPL